MDTLNYEVLAKSGYNGYILKNAPEKVLQFGEGNFLRAFVDYWFDLALPLITISEPTSQAETSYAAFCLKKKKKHK